MTTGFVHDMLDKEQTFEQFAWSCAKAFGSLERKEVSPSQLREVEVAECKVELYRSLSEDSLRKIGADRKQDSLARLREGQAADRAQRDKMRAMADCVEAWQPPPELRELKEFMLGQLWMSMPEGEQDFWAEQIYDLERRSDLEVARSMIENELRYLDRQRENVEAERQRVEKHNAMLAVLEGAIPRPA